MLHDYIWHFEAYLYITSNTDFCHIVFLKVRVHIQEYPYNGDKPTILPIVSAR